MANASKLTKTEVRRAARQARRDLEDCIEHNRELADVAEREVERPDNVVYIRPKGREEIVE